MLLTSVTYAPCPNCGSGNARWRGRRLYDFLFTWIDALARSSAFLPDYESTWPFTEEPFIESREPVSWKTPSHFWHCPDCGQRGEED